MHVFSVPSSAPFLLTVIAALIDGDLVDGFNARAHPERLIDATIYLPTQRACRMAREIFLDVLKTDAAVLPRMVALGDVDEDELEFAQAEHSGLDALDVPPALGGLERRLALAQLVGAWAARLKPGDPAAAPLVAGGPASTLALADDLARLIDDMTTRGIDWRALDGLVPEEHDEYWQRTLEFLKIARDTWPAHLHENSRIDPVARRDRLIEAEGLRLKVHPRGPVIAAGSTGSMPSTARFLNVIAGLPQGAVVLPGLDLGLDDAAWQSIEGAKNSDGAHAEATVSNHPQFALHGLLTTFGIRRKDVRTLGAPAEHSREILLSEAMRPAGTTSIWHEILQRPEIAKKIAEGLQNLSVIEAANPEAEALAIAVAMREAREQNKTAALVTPDRALARRVMAALGRWNLDYDDSGGDSLMDTPAGIFARLAANVVAENVAPAELLAVLKHPLFRLGARQDTYKTTIADLEMALLRGTRPTAGSAGLLHDFKRFREELGKHQRKELSALHASEPRTRLETASLDAVQTFIEQLIAAIKPLEVIGDRRKYDFSHLAALHFNVIGSLSKDDNENMIVFDGVDGKSLSRAFDELFRRGDFAIDDQERPAPPSGLMVTLADYPEVFETAFADRIVRRPLQPSASLRIYGLLEARLTQCDRVILGGLVEGVWPPQPRIDPWLSRPMRHQLGLNLPERRIGLTAHDFAQLLGAKEVILTHAAKIAGAPTVASRFLHRLEAVAGEKWKTIRQAGDKYIYYAAELDRPDEIKPVPQPMPKPALALRPLKMSVTEIESWLRDPYSIFAKHVLKLTPLDPVDTPLSAADRGSAIHDALGDFTTQYPEALPPDAAKMLCDIGATHFAPLMERPEARALWWPRFKRIAAWFAQWENDRRMNAATIDAEQRGEINISLGNGRVFTLSARADRIEHRRDRTFAILDYKTGAPPSGKQVRLGLSPQLTLEAAILRGGGFKDIPAGASVSELVYVRLSGNNPPGKENILELKVGKGDTAQSPDDAADEARQKLETMIRAFENENQGYASLALPMWSNRFGRYDDVARIKEWSAAGGRGEETP